MLLSKYFYNMSPFQISINEALPGVWRMSEQEHLFQGKNV